MTDARSAQGRHDKNEVYDTLVAEILSGELPAGSPLSERALVARFGISRTPIRQVLWQLQQNDLVTLHANRGTFVKKLGVHEIVELFELREALEPLACALAATRRPQAELESLQAKFERAASRTSPPDHLVALGGTLHNAIVGWSGNRMLQRVYEVVQMQTQLMRNLLRNAHELEWASMKEHMRILRAIEARDAETARSTMDEHLRRSRKAILDNLFEGASGGAATATHGGDPEGNT